MKAEVCGAVFAARLRKYIEKHSRMQVECWLHLLDICWEQSKETATVTRPSLQTEWEKSTSVEDWRWIPGDQNIAEAPEDLKEDSVWQNGPEFLKRPVEEWPTKSAKEVAAYARESINKLQRKCLPELRWKETHMLHLPLEYQCLQSLLKSKLAKVRTWKSALVEKNTKLKSVDHLLVLQ